jgi:hypothetical protein
VATLSIFNRFTMELLGVEHSGKQGSAESEPEDSYDITVDGTYQGQSGTLATNLVRGLWDEDEDNPTGFDYLFFWADQDCYLQLIGQATNVILKIEANVPFTLSSDQMLAAANTTGMSAGVAPSVEAIDAIYLSNLSGENLDYLCVVID